MHAYATQRSNAAVPPSPAVPPSAGHRPRVYTPRHSSAVRHAYARHRSLLGWITPHVPRSQLRRCMHADAAARDCTLERGHGVGGLGNGLNID